MDMEIALAIELIDQTASEDLEACQTAVRAGDRDAALACLGQAISRLGAARDALQDIPRTPQDLGLQTSGF
ncbi:MAG: hypothetical protein JWO72_2772 [Caulobacteraceae bacterium]|nr:hypothetical protein [Caulobacteraceae bacterium]